MDIADDCGCCVNVKTVVLSMMAPFSRALLNMACVTRRHMKLTVGTLLSMTNYLAELAEIRAVLGEMIVTAMSADHR